MVIKKPQELASDANRKNPKKKMKNLKKKLWSRFENPKMEIRRLWSQPLFLEKVKFYSEKFEKSESKTRFFQNRISENFRKCTYSIVRAGSICIIIIYHNNIYYIFMKYRLW